ncbi:MAG: nucleotide exchange factor GrpE [Anaerovoracaceae bacterium]
MSEEKKQEEMQDEELVTEAEETETSGESDPSAKSADPEKDETSENGDDAGESKEDGEKKESSAEEEALNVKYMRLMADFQNFKRRTEKEKSDIYAFANEKIISELLNVIDNFERALLHGAAGDSFAEGMNMIFKQLQGVLEKAGVKEIEALGLDFDPNFHNAVMTEDSTEYESGKVTEVLQKGYTLNSKVIRPSMVKVAN